MNKDTIFTEVYFVSSGEVVGTWNLPPERAVVAAERQLVHRDFNTWEYGKFHPREGTYGWGYGEHGNEFWAKKI